MNDSRRTPNGLNQRAFRTQKSLSASKIATSYIISGMSKLRAAGRSPRDVKFTNCKSRMISTAPRCQYPSANSALSPRCHSDNRPVCHALGQRGDQHALAQSQRECEFRSIRRQSACSPNAPESADRPSRLTHDLLSQSIGFS